MHTKYTFIIFKIQPVNKLRCLHIGDRFQGLKVSVMMGVIINDKISTFCILKIVVHNL